MMKTLRIFRFETLNLPKSFGDPACWQRAAGSLFSVSGNSMSGGQGSGVQGSGFRGQRTENRGRKSEDRAQMSGVRFQEIMVNNQWRTINN